MGRTVKDFVFATEPCGLVLAQEMNFCTVCGTKVE